MFLALKTLGVRQALTLFAVVIGLATVLAASAAPVLGEGLACCGSSDCGGGCICINTEKRCMPGVGGCIPSIPCCEVDPSICWDLEGN